MRDDRCRRATRMRIPSCSRRCVAESRPVATEARRLANCQAPDNSSGLLPRTSAKRRGTGDAPMKFTWFNLMPWPYLPDDFREKNRSVWVDIDSRLFDPVKSHEVYNTYMDLLEYAVHAGLRRHRRERASPERLRHHAEPEHHRGGAGAAHQGCGPCRARQFDRALQSAGARGGGVRDARLHLGRAAGRGLSRRHLDGHELLLRPDPGADAREICRSARSHQPRVERGEAVRVQRPLQQAAPCEHLAAPDPEAAADPHSRRRQRRDLRFLHRQHLFLFVPRRSAATSAARR